MNLNKAIICGRLTRDPEGKALPSGAAVTNFSLATNRTWVTDGEKKEETEFHNVVVFGKQGETCTQFLRKGDTALVEGRIQTRSWEGEADKQYRMEIIADRVQFGPKGGGERGDTSDEDIVPENASAPAAKEKHKPADRGYDYPDDINPDDIPF